METKVGDCPLGAKCQETKDGALYICPWYVKLVGKDPQSEQQLDEYRCAIAWMPILQIEHSMHERQTGASVESFRNEMTKQNEKVISRLTEKKHELIGKVG